MSKKDERQKSKAAAKSAVASVLAEDEAIQKIKMEEVFAEYESQLSDLREAEVAAQEKTTELSTKIEELSAEKEGLESEITALKEELTKVKAELEESIKNNADLQDKLSAMEKEAATKKRLTELEEAGLFTSDKITDKLTSRIKKMSDEEFEDWKDDLVSLKASITPAVVEKPAPAKEPEAASVEEEQVEDVVEETKEKGAGEQAKANTAKPAQAAQTENANVDDSESAQETLDKLRKIREELKQELASVNIQTTIGSLKDDEHLVKEFASMWQPVKEEE